MIFTPSIYDIWLILIIIDSLIISITINFSNDEKQALHL